MKSPQRNAGRASNSGTAQSFGLPTIPVTTPAGKPIDLSARSQRMGRDECICWRNKDKTNLHPTRPDFRGNIRLSGGVGHYFHVGLWQRDQWSFRVIFSPWDHPNPRTCVEPSSDRSRVKVNLISSRDNRDVFTGESRSARIKLQPAIANGQNVWWLQLSAKKGVEK